MRRASRVPARAGGVAPVRLEVREQLGPYSPAWDALLDEQPLPSPFLRSWWLEHTARHHPCFVLVLDGERLVGGLALEEDRRLGVPRLLPMGSALAPDHVELIAAPDREADVVAAVSRWLDRRGQRLVDLVGVAGGGRLLDALPDAEVEVVEIAPYSPLAPTFEEYLSWRTPDFRRQVGQKRRRLLREGAAYHVVDDNDRERALTTLRELHGGLFGDRSPFLAYYDYFAAAASAAPPGELVFHELRADGEVIASSVTVEVAGRLSNLQSGRREDQRWRAAGTVLQGFYIERGCEIGLREFDHLRGDHAYKRSWAPLTRELLHVRTAKGIAASAVGATFDFMTSERVAAGVRRGRIALSRSNSRRARRGR